MRTEELVKALKRREATDIQASPQRELAIFRDHKGRLNQLYWWQKRGVYQVGRYPEGGEMKMIRQFVDRDAAIDIALSEEDVGRSLSQDREREAEAESTKGRGDTGDRRDP